MSGDVSRGELHSTGRSWLLVLRLLHDVGAFSMTCIISYLILILCRMCLSVVGVSVQNVLVLRASL